MNNGATVEYFDYNGRRYYSGSKFKCKDFITQDCTYTEIEVTFIKKTKSNMFTITKLNSLNRPVYYAVNGDEFLNNILSVMYAASSQISNEAPYEIQGERYYTWTEDGEKNYRVVPEEVYMGWFFYVIVLLGSLIFKGFFIIWIAASIIFWPWRNNKLKGRG